MEEHRLGGGERRPIPAAARRLVLAGTPPLCVWRKFWDGLRALQKRGESEASD
ncbi:hypothetical protein GUJ93_ZPchr0012g20406, partial [Zizania palustris]